MSSIVKSYFSKRTIYSGDQYYDIDVTIVNNIDYTINIKSSQRLKTTLDINRDSLAALIDDLQEIYKMSSKNNTERG